jgi:predicted RecB family nuclease
LKLFHGTILFSAADILNFLDCEHHTFLDLTDLETPLPRTDSSEELKLIQTRGQAHEARYAGKLKKDGTSFVDIEQAGDTLNEKVQATLEAMRSGVDIIYQPHLKKDNLFGIADFMSKVARPSELGGYSYEIIDAKLALSPKTRFVIQLAFYTFLLSKIQETEPRHMRVVLGDQTEKIFGYHDYSRYLKSLLARFLKRTGQSQNIDDTYPDPCEHCDLCKWLELCEQKRLDDDHLCQVAGITRAQIKKIKDYGINKLEELGSLKPNARIPGMAQQTSEKIIRQARLQLKARLTGENQLEILSLPQGEIKGFARMPRPSDGDMFFDMEGNPLQEGGLEYLFGVYFFEDNQPKFRAFWGHDRNQEKRAFEKFMDFVFTRLKEYPDAYIYHYAHYEATALKKLMSLHGTREAEVDNLLRLGKLIDLYKVVRESIRVSEPSYSIKNLEHFYMEKRQGGVQDAGASIIYYERWKETGDDSLLQDIEDYNLDDVRSTYELREWLLTLRPKEIPWADDIKDTQEKIQEIGELNEHEQRILKYRELLVDLLPEDRSLWSQKDRIRELTWQLLDFYRRADKPVWWAMFSRMDMDEQALIDDPECLGGLVLDKSRPPKPKGRSFIYEYSFPEQETKIKPGDNIICLKTQTPVRNLEIDEENKLATFVMSSAKDMIKDKMNIGPGGPINNKVLREAVFRFADSLIAGDNGYAALAGILSQSLPKIKGHKQGDPVIDETRPILDQMKNVVSRLDSCSLFIQGPPGSGKTYTGSHVIVDLLRQGFKVGVSSNSHKAINNLLQAVEKVAIGEGFSFLGVKKCTKGNEGSLLQGEIIENVFDNDDINSRDYQLVAGTAWLFSRPDLEQSLDYLFVDEAGQVALANLIAMGTSARNIVLLGDQMQLGQPIQGTHPGRSGESSLEYLLSGLATIPPERGIFLKTTWRMHPDVCRLISDMVYDSRLEPEPHNQNQTLLLQPGLDPILLPTGIRYIPAMHDACTQKSFEEAQIIKELMEQLVGQKCIDRNGREHELTLENILVVAPYNMQVNLLKRMLPEGARVGTVDKFQGQQAEVVMISMATSSADYLPRHIDFLYSKNRLNVAISRAKCLAVLVANPQLMSIKCSKPEEVALVNSLCWVRDYSEEM